MANDIKAELEAATTSTGILAVNPSGDLVRLRPGAVKIAASVENGLYLTGLKPGWKLADKTAIDKAKAGAAGGEKANPRGKPSPKRAGA